MPDVSGWCLRKKAEKFHREFPPNYHRISHLSASLIPINLCVLTIYYLGFALCRRVIVATWLIFWFRMVPVLSCYLPGCHLLQDYFWSSINHPKCFLSAWFSQRQAWHLQLNKKTRSRHHWVRSSNLPLNVKIHTASTASWNQVAWTILWEETFPLLEVEI